MEEARQIGTILIEKQLVACVNCIPGVESIYQWEGKLHCDKEVLLMMKTTRARYAQLEEVLLELHPYETPEVLSSAVEGGASAYLSWVRAQVGMEH